jgi:hypothetical protein
MLMDLLIGTKVKDLLEHLKSTRTMINVGHSACKIGSLIFHAIRENVQDMENAP